MRIVRSEWLSGKLLLGLTLLNLALAGHHSASAYTVRAARPRIWLTPSLLTDLRQRASANSPRWVSLKNVCDTQMGSSSPWASSVSNYALAYQVTGNPAYGDKAIALAKIQVDMGMNALFQLGTHGYDCRTVLPDVAIAYDWCYDRFTPTLRGQFRAQLEQWADWVWPETNASRVGGWSVENPGDNFYHGFMMTWLVGIALYGDSPKAQGYIDVALKRWNTQARPFMEKYQAGGYLLEGTNYGEETLGRIFKYLTAHATATGEDFMNSPGFDWPRQAVTARLYLTLPERTRLFPGGDQPRDATATLSDNARTSMLVALGQMDPSTAGQARWWLDHITPNRNAWRWVQWEEFLWYRDVASVDYTQTLSPGYLASGAGWMTSRSDWGPDATYVAMICGPTRESHQDLAQNDFQIYRKEWLAASARLTGGYGILRDAQYHNTFTIGGLGQPEVRAGLPQDLSKVARYAETTRYAYFEGEAKDAYTYWKWPGPVPVLNGFRRRLLYLKPGRVLVFDRVDAVDASQVKEWHLNVINEPKVTGNSYQTSAGGSTLFGTRLLPLDGVVAKVPINQGKNGVLSSWRIDVSAPTGRKLDTFLNVLEVAPATQAGPTPAQSLTTNRSDLIGAVIGDQAVLFDTAPAASTMSYRTTAREHFIVNVPLGKWFQIAAVSAVGSAPLQRVQATDQGILYFSLQGVMSRQVTITPQ